MSSTSEIDRYVRGQVAEVLSKSLSDKEAVARAIADDAEDVLWKRLRIANLAAVGILFFLGIAGLKTANSLKDLQILTRGLNDKYRQADLSLTTIQTQLDHVKVRAAQISGQVTAATTSAVIGGLGVQEHITYNQHPWNGLSTKRPGEKWVAVNVDVERLSTTNPALFNKFVDKINASGYVAFVGNFAVDGAFEQGFENPGPSSQQAVISYLDQTDAQRALEIVNMAQKIFPMLKVTTVQISVTALQQESLKLIVEKSGIDFWITL